MHAGQMRRCPRPERILTIAAMRITNGNDHVSSMRNAVLIAVVALTAGFLVMPVGAEERPSDPFGNHTVELTKDAPLVAIWEFLRAQMKREKAYFHECLE